MTLYELINCPGQVDVFGCQIWNLRDMNLRNDISGEMIYPDTQWEEIDLEYAKSIAAAMYGLGMVEIAVEPSDMVAFRPASGIKQIL